MTTTIGADWASIRYRFDPQSAEFDDGDRVPLTLPALVAERAAARAAHPLLVCDDDTLTYGELDERSAALARGLLAMGAGKGTHVGLFFPNGSAFVVAAMAAARIGAVVVPLSTFSTAGELRRLLYNADIEILLASASHRGRDHTSLLGELVPGPELPALRRVVVDHDGPGSITELIEAGEATDASILGAVEALVHPGDRLVIVHTSGSTSEPKGVIHQHGPLLAHQANLNVLRRYDSSEILFSNSPFFWIGGFAYSLLGTMAAGATLVCSNSTDAAATLDLLERVRPTMVNGFAQTVAHLAAHESFAARDLSSIRRGNLWPIMPAETRPADPELRHNLLGTTETGSVCLASDDESDQPEHRRGSFGHPVPGFEARIVDDGGADCPTGTLGELWLRGPFLMEGYYGRERHETFEPDGWYRTGDLFHIDDDGFFYFHGRTGDMIKTAGANVSPREVEAAILAETGLVAHVIGLDDAERGQIVAAALRLLDGHPGVDVEALRTALRGRLSAYKVPRRIVALPEHTVPVLSSGKIDSRALARLLGERAHGS